MIWYGAAEIAKAEVRAGEKVSILVNLECVMFGTIAGDEQVGNWNFRNKDAPSRDAFAVLPTVKPLKATRRDDVSARHLSDDDDDDQDAGFEPRLKWSDDLEHVRTIQLLPEAIKRGFLCTQPEPGLWSSFDAAELSRVDGWMGTRQA